MELPLDELQILLFVLAPWISDLPLKLSGPQLIKKFPTPYKTWKFITANGIIKRPSLSKDQVFR